MRYREFTLFHGERVLAEYLLAYQRCSSGHLVRTRLARYRCRETPRWVALRKK